MKKLTFVLCLISLATPAFAQQATYPLGRFSFTSPLQVAVTQDNNFLMDKTDPTQRLFFLSLPPTVQLGLPAIGPKRVSDQVMTLTMPALTFQNSSRRHELSANYVPEFEVFRTNSDQNAWNHKAIAGLTYFPSRTTRFSISDEYLGSQDASRVLRSPFLLLPRNPFRQNAVKGSFEIEVSPVTAVNVTYTNMLTTFGQTDPFQTRILDTTTNGFSFNVKRSLTRQQRLSGTYSFYKVKPINKQRLNDDAVDAKRQFEYPVQSVNLQYRYSFTASSVVEFLGGLSNMNNSTSYVMNVGGYRRFGEFLFGAGFSREMSVAASPLTFGATSFYDVASIRVSGQPTRNVGLQMEIGGALNASRAITGGRSLLSRGRFDYRLTDRTVTFASVETYHQPLNDYVRAPLSRSRFTVGIEFSLASDVQRRTDPRNQDDQYVGLTDHARRRLPPE